MIIKRDTVIGGSKCYSTEYVVRAWCYIRNGEPQIEDQHIYEMTFSDQYNDYELISMISIEASRDWYEGFKEDLDIRRIDIIEMTP